MNENSNRFENSALLIIDMINDFCFPDGNKLASEAEKIVGPIAQAKALFLSHGLPVIYVNDNFDRWNASFADIVDWTSRGGSRGRAIVGSLLPTPDDYFILKPRHSAFYETALPSLLARLGTKRVAVAGIAGDSCVLASALDAHIRKLDIWVPSNASASLTAERNRRAMQFVAESLGGDVAPVGGSSP